MVFVGEKAEVRLALDEGSMLYVVVFGEERLDGVDADGEDDVGLLKDLLGGVEGGKAEDAQHSQHIRM